LTHGNSLKQLLEQHTVIKVKVNTRSFDGSLQQAFEQLCQLAEENGAPPGIELIQTREGENIMMFGWPGTMKRIQDGEFPLPPPPPWVPPERT
jgi:RNA-binding protein YhbY